MKPVPISPGVVLLATTKTGVPAATAIDADEAPGGPGTGTPPIFAVVASPGYPLIHAQSSAKGTRRAGLSCPEPLCRQDAPLRPGRGLRGVPARHDRGASASPDPRPVLLRLIQPLAFRRLARGRRPGHR